MNRTSICHILIFFFSSFLFAQNTITVKDAKTLEPIANAEILNGAMQRIGTTNANGIFTVPKEINNIVVLASNYKDKQWRLEQNQTIILLQSLQINLEELSFSNDDSYARTIIKKIIANQRKNSPENLESFQYKTYTKFWVNAEKDNIPLIPFPQNAKDSAHNQERKFLEKSMFFLSERAMDHKYDKQFGRKNIVKANRVSGLKTPLYELAAAQPISHEFNQQEFSFFFRKYTNPVSKNGLRTYSYRVQDSLVLNNKTVLVLAFKPKTNAKKKKAIRGKIWVETEQYNLVKFKAEAISKEIAELEMDWVKFKDYYFPKEQRFLFELGNISFPVETDSLDANGILHIDTIKKKEPIWAKLVNNFLDYESPVVFQRKEFKGYKNEIAKDAYENWAQIMPAYRTAKLDSFEWNTYKQIDSIATAEKAERALKLFRIASTKGQLDLGKINLDLNKLFGYNAYEGFRLGAGFTTNYKWNEKLSFNAYTAYGFKDKRFKFGAGTEYLVNAPYSGKLFANYQQDVQASGRTNFVLRNPFARLLSENQQNFYNDEFYRFKHWRFGYEQDILQNLTVNLSANYQQIQPTFDYAYQNQSTDFDFTFASLALRWAPKNQYIRTPFGKFAVDSGFPYFYLTYSQGIDFLGSDFNPSKLDFMLLHKTRTWIGRTNILLRAGLVLGDSPIMNLFEGYGNARNGTSIGGRFGLARQNLFETMQAGEFYSDQYLSLHLRHQVAGFRLFKKEIYPFFIYRSLLGTMQSPEIHENLNFSVPKGLYQEAGIEFNSIILKSLGFGFYYRFGAYSLGNIEQNLSWKITFGIDDLF